MQLPRLDSPWPWLTALAALVLLVAARRGPATRAWWSGTLGLWRGLARAPQARRGVRRLPPPAVVCAAAALVAGGLALAGPRAAADADARAWSVHVDASPSMFLPVSAEAGVPTRLERALTLAEAALAERGADPERTRWLRAGEEARGARAPRDWLRPPSAPQPPPAWAALDRPGTLWVSDDAGGELPERALACLSGGAAVPGPVAALGRARLAGGPAGLDRSPDAAAAPRLRVAAAVASAPLGTLVEAWAAARGVLRVEEGPAELTLELAGADRGPRGTPWRASGGAAAVAWEPGRIDLTADALLPPAGDPAAFAAAWSELLDRACLPPAGVVAVAERAAAGEPRTLGGGLSAPSPEPRTGDAGASVLALVAALCGAAAVSLAGRG